MENKSSLPRYRYLIIGVSLVLLALVYLFQRTDYLNGFLNLIHAGGASPSTAFAVNKAFRLILNDVLCIALIYALFGERKYIRVAFVLFCFELFIILPLYLIVKLSIEGSSEISSPLLSQIHRLVVNPMLMLILIAGLYYQRNRALK